MRQDRVFQAAVQVCAAARNSRMRNVIQDRYKICARGTRIVLVSLESSAATVATELVQRTIPIFRCEALTTNWHPTTRRVPI